MRDRFLLLLLLSPLLLAEDQAKKVQRLEKVIWNPITHVLSWRISEGHIDVHGQYEPERLVGSFFIEPQAATMSVAGKKQGFTHQEGDHLHDILDSLQSAVQVLRNALNAEKGFKQTPTIPQRKTSAA